MLNFLKKNICTIIIILLLYVSNDTILFGTNSIKIMPYIAFLVLLLICFILFLKVDTKNLSRKKFFVLFGLIFISFMTAFFKDTLSDKYIYEFLLLIIAFLFTHIFSIKTFMIKYTDALLIISKLSLVSFTVGTLFSSILNYFPTIINKSGIIFKNLFISCVPFDIRYNLASRNFSFFREPGVFAIFIIIALIFLITNKKENKNFVRKFVILSLTLFSTKSTGGIICLFLILLYYWLKEKNINKKVLFAFAIFVVLIIFFKSEDMINSIFGKLFVVNSSKVSRESAIFINLKIFFNNILLGAGWENIMNLYEKTAISIYSDMLINLNGMFHNTNTIFKILSVHGIAFFIIYIKGFIVSVFNIENKKGFFVLLFLILCLAFSNEDISLNFILPFLVMYGYDNKKRCLNENY